jgi:hypothetical protein
MKTPSILPFFFFDFSSCKKEETQATHTNPIASSSNILFIIATPNSSVK